MRSFRALYDALDATTRTNEKVAAMRSYFAEAPAADAAWALFFLTGQRLKRTIGWKTLREIVLERSGLSPWLLDECYSAVGDLAETIALLAPDHAENAERDDVPLHRFVDDHVLTLRSADDGSKHARLGAALERLPPSQLYLLIKMLTGELRVGVSRTLAIRAVAEAHDLDPGVVAHRLMGDFQPSAEAFRRIVDPDTADAARSQPYPFCLAHPLEQAPESLGPIDQWLVEWKWDGIRAQLVRRGGETFLWSRGEELITERFPEVSLAARKLPDDVTLDGELLAYRDGTALPFGALQRRIGRKALSRKILRQVPVAMLCFDLLEEDGEDLRERPLADRRAGLEALLANHGASALTISPAVDAESYHALDALREGARERGVEGLMLKRRSSPYHVGRKKGDWWKWKIDPLTVDCVMTYAQPGHGRRASLLTDYGFSVWDGDALVPVAQAYSGLTDDELGEIDAWIRAHTVERRGRLRMVEPTLVFELCFEAIRRSSRHASGVALRFPRIARIRRDKRPEDADTLERLVALVDAYGWEPEKERRAEQLGLFGED